MSAPSRDAANNEPNNIPQRRLLITNYGLQEMVALAGCQRAHISKEVVDALFLLSEELVDDIASLSIALASHRGSPFVDVRDVQLALEKKYNLQVPGYVTGSRMASGSIQMDPHTVNRVRAAIPTETHMRRLANAATDSASTAPISGSRP